MCNILLGKKLGMTQIFSKTGDTIPVTILQIGPCTVTQVKTKQQEKKSYIQIGYEYICPKKLKKPNINHFKKNGIPCFKYLKEYKTKSADIPKIGQILTINKFSVGNYVNISGTSIGKGFSGYQKKHHFNRGPMSHGSTNHRQPGSIGAGTTPGRVFPGKKMAGRMGNTKVTIKNLEIVSLNTRKNIIIIKGSIPGKNGNIIYMHKK